MSRGSAYRFNGEYDQAIADYTQAIKIYPSPGAYSDRGAAYNNKGEYDRAIADLDSPYGFTQTMQFLTGIVRLPT